MILFHQRLPCSENFFRYFKNYDKYMEEKRAEEGSQCAAQTTAANLEFGKVASSVSTVSNDGSNQNSEGGVKGGLNSAGDSSSTSSVMNQLSKSPVRSIESPKYGLALSPIQKFMRVHSPPHSQSNLAKTGTAI